MGNKENKILKTIILKNIKKLYGDEDNKVYALNGIDLKIETNKFTVIVGPSGSGKSTLLHCMAGLDKPTSGKVYFNNIDIYKINDEELSKIRRKEFGFIFQSYNLIPVISIYDNIILPIKLDGKKEDENYINHLIEKLGILNQINKFPNELSGGQQQRVAIARALANKPSIIFADEPTGNLDSKNTKEVMDILKTCVNEFNQTLVMITHNYDIAKKADRIISIFDGNISDII